MNSDFDGRGEPELALGTVTGVRVFSFGGFAGQTDDAGALKGQQGAQAWTDGENLAQCMGGGRNAASGEHIVPHPPCGCGFWAYWQMDAARLHFNPPAAVLAVVEGYGRTLIGDRGFRCAKARIVALHLAFNFATRQARVPTDPGWHDAFAGHDDVPAAENEAMKAACEQILSDRYPGAAIFATQRLMLIKHPPTADYLPEPRYPEPPSLAAQVASARTPAFGWTPVTVPAPPLSARQSALLKNWPGRIIRSR